MSQVRNIKPLLILVFYMFYGVMITFFAELLYMTFHFPGKDRLNVGFFQCSLKANRLLFHYLVGLFHMFPESTFFSTLYVFYL